MSKKSSSRTISMDLEILQLPVRQGFNLPDDRLLTDPIFTEGVLLSGVIVAKKKSELEKRHILDQETESLRNDYAKSIKTFEHTESLLRKEIESLKNQLSNIMLSNQEIFENGRTAGKAELRILETVIQEKNQTINNLQDKIQREVEHIGRIFTKQGKSVEIGNFGEALVESYLAELRSGKTSYKGNDPGSGDFFFEYQNAKILIEVKNKSHLCKTKDLLKFHNDIVENKDEIHGAILINLQDTNLIHGIKKSYFEVRNNVPVMYVGDVIRVPSVISVAVEMLCCIANTRQYNYDEESSTDGKEFSKIAKNTAERIVRMVHREQINIEKERKYVQALLQSLETRQSAILDFNNYREELKDLFPNIEQEAIGVTDSFIPVTVGGSDGIQKAITEKDVIAFVEDRQRRGMKVSESDIVKHLDISRNKIQAILKDHGGIKKLRMKLLKTIDVATEEEGVKEEQEGGELAHNMVEQTSPKSSDEFNLSPEVDEFLAETY